MFLRAIRRWTLPSNLKKASWYVTMPAMKYLKSMTKQRMTRSCVLSAANFHRWIKTSAPTAAVFCSNKKTIKIPVFGGRKPGFF